MASSGATPKLQDGRYMIIWEGKELGFVVTIDGSDAQFSDLNGSFSSKLEINYGVFDHPDKRGLEVTGAREYNLQSRGSTKKDILDCGVVSEDGKSMTMMNGCVWLWLDEEAFQQKKNNTDPVDNMPNDYECKPPGKLVWLTGGTGMGKSTTATYMKENAGFVHYEGDCFIYGINPYVGAAPQGSSLFGPRVLRGISEERKAACQRAFDGYKNLKEGKEAEASIWEDLYALMCDEISSEREKVGGDWLINQGVYKRAARDLIRSKLGDKVKFVFLDMSPELQASRLAKREKGYGEITEEVLEMKRQECQKKTFGYERKQDDEPNSLQIMITEFTKTEDIVNSIIEFVK